MSNQLLFFIIVQALVVLYSLRYIIRGINFRKRNSREWQDAVKRHEEYWKNKNDQH